MADYVIRVGSSSVRGLRANNEDRFVADAKRHFYLVADGMGGQEFGERASGMAADIIPAALDKRLAAHESAESAVLYALDEANQAIIRASKDQTPGRRMGTTAVLAVRQNDRVVVANVGDSRAYLIRGGQVDLLTRDHTVADALERNGTLTHEQANASPWKNVLYKFLGCPEMTEGPELHPFEPRAGDRLVLGSDGLTNFINDDDLRQGTAENIPPQRWAEQLVQLALARGTKDNVTCVVVAFEAA